MHLGKGPRKIETIAAHILKTIRGRARESDRHNRRIMIFVKYMRKSMRIRCVMSVGIRASILCLLISEQETRETTKKKE
jgi:hypothetical protein